MKNPHIRVTVVDTDKRRIDAWKSDDLPVSEPGLDSIVHIARDGDEAAGRKPNLFFSDNVSSEIEAADLIFIAVNTPTKTTGAGAGCAADVAHVESAARCIAEASRTDKIIVEKSTVPCGTASILRTIFDVLAPGIKLDILSNPEFLAEGTAIRDLLNPDRVLLGSLEDDSSLAAVNALMDVYAAWVPRSRIITTNLWSSELAKLAANCMLAQRISSINSFSAICEATGANVDELAQAIGTDSRLGNKMLRPSVGFGGSCFKKDVLSLVYIAESLHLPEIAHYWRMVVTINEYQKQRVARRIIQQLNNTLLGKRIAILGFAYKKDTSDTRETAAISIILQLLAERAIISVYDPQVTAETVYDTLERQRAPYDGEVSVIRSNVKVCRDAVTACANASAVVILTEWDHFKTDRVYHLLADQKRSIFAEQGTETSGTCSPTSSKDSAVDVSDPARPSPTLLTAVESAKLERIDWVSIARVVRKPGLVFDGRGVVDSCVLRSLGLRVECIGKPSATTALQTT